MNTLAGFGNYFFVIFSVSVNAIPSEVCYANFRWDDCGKPPVPVMYYWKSGSRCEVAMWRGCLPNPNMFPDEYSCINTCVFVQRADLYNMGVQAGDENEQIMEIDADETTQTAANDASDVTTLNEDSGSNSTGGVPDGGTNVTTADGLVTGDTGDGVVTGDTGDGTADVTSDASINNVEDANEAAS